MCGNRGSAGGLTPPARQEARHNRHNQSDRSPPSPACGNEKRDGGAPIPSRRSHSLVVFFFVLVVVVVVVVIEVVV